MPSSCGWAASVRRGWRHRACARRGRPGSCRRCRPWPPRRCPPRVAAGRGPRATAGRPRPSRSAGHVPQGRSTSRVVGHPGGLTRRSVPSWAATRRRMPVSPEPPRPSSSTRRGSGSSCCVSPGAWPRTGSPHCSPCPPRRASGWAIGSRSSRTADRSRRTVPRPWSTRRARVSSSRTRPPYGCRSVPVRTAARAPGTVDLIGLTAEPGAGERVASADRDRVAGTGLNVVTGAERGERDRVAGRRLGELASLPHQLWGACSAGDLPSIAAYITTYLVESLASAGPYSSFLNTADRRSTVAAALRWPPS